MPTCKENCVSKCNADTDKAIDDYEAGTLDLAGFRSRMDEIAREFDDCVANCNSSSGAPACLATLLAKFDAICTDLDADTIDKNEAKSRAHEAAATFATCAGGGA